MATISNYYQLYMDKVLLLAETIIIKSDDTVSGLNQFVNDQSNILGTPPVDMLDPTSWKYYLNISGNYHHLDTSMQVVSLDTLQNIEFNKANLNLHVATAKGYQYNSRLYKILLTEYPEQELLIKGILYPVDISIAISANDGAILGYPDGLVEVNEYSLISKLQQWINGYKIRWSSRQFGISDNLYAATSLGIMYLNLIPTILNIRLESCKTNEAHSFHIHQYLASHGLLNTYIDNMTTKQALFFYRNIAYIERNSGKKAVFDWLVENVMTARKLPVAEYKMRHSLVNQPANIYPDLLFRKSSVNGQYDADMGIDFTLQQMLDKQDALAKDNLSYKEDTLLATKVSMENSISNTVLTKMLESAVIDNSNSAPYTLTDILLNHWIWLSVSGNYNAFINVTNPKTGEGISLSVKDAYTLAWYVYCKSINIVQVLVPSVLAKRVQRIIPQPNVNSLGASSNVVNISEIMSVVDPALVSITDAQQALSLQPEVFNIISTQAFYDFCTRIYNAAQMQYNLVASKELSIARAMALGMVSRIYSDNICMLAPVGETYANWLTSNTLSVDTLNTVELNILYADLMQQSTGLALNTTSSLRDMQRAMISIMEQLSSYSVQFISTINATDLQKTNWTAVRIGSVGLSSETTHITDLASDINSVSASFENSITSGLGIGSDVNSVALNITNTVNITLKEIIRSTMLALSTYIKVNTTTVSHLYRTPQLANVNGIVSVMGLSDYTALTKAQWGSIRDIYGSIVTA